MYIFHGGRHISLRFSIVHLLICNLRKTEHEAARRRDFILVCRKVARFSHDDRTISQVDTLVHLSRKC